LRLENAKRELLDNTNHRRNHHDFDLYDHVGDAVEGFGVALQAERVQQVVD
jgi:hypothetical protein